jgi:thiamine pyrophosphate-dependent acetolactate synthase large subunit-like protein
MQQVDIIRHLAQAAQANGALVVSEIGSQTQWLHSTGDHPSYLYLSGPMGMAPSVALGVALAQPDKPVLAICGDGALAMNLNALATISYMSPKNLTIAVMDNGIYDLTGKVASPSAGLDYAKLAASLKGVKTYQTIDTDSTIVFSASQGLTLLHAVIEKSADKAPSFPLQPTHIHARFQDFLKQC